MTELEKKAIDVIRNHSHKLIDNFTQEDLENREISIFLAGYHEGNKANEWHFMKDEFPPENVPLNIITLDKNKKKRLWEGEYQGGNGNWWSGYFNHLIDVPYAWKEIVLPEFLKE